MSQKRYTASTITDPALDELYDNASKAWRRGDGWKQRAEQAEATVARLLAWCDELDRNTQNICRDPNAEHPVAAHVRARIAPPQE